MIISRAPFRISLFGGGTDLPAFYEQNGRGAVVSFSIKKYMYIIIHPYFHDKIRMKYSKTEDVDKADQLEHPLARECLKKFNVRAGLEIASIADIPSGTGLGSSSAFTVGMLGALTKYSGGDCDQASIAEWAAKIEIYNLKQPIGKQDHYGSAIGGLKHIEFLKNGTVKVDQLPSGRAEIILENILLFYVGIPRSAISILQEQSKNMSSPKEYLVAKNLLDISDASKQIILNGDLQNLGELLHESWECKKKLSLGISNPYIDHIYDKGMKNGALGAKLLGAGGGGFMLFYCPVDRQMELRHSMQGLKELKVELDLDGVSIIHNE